MSIKAFGYYGGKYSKLGFILPQLETQHDAFVEVCAGSTAVLLNKPCVKHEIVNDLANEVTNFWCILRDHKDELIEAILDSPAGESEFKRIIKLPSSDNGVENARRFYVEVQQAFSNALGCGGYSYVRASRYKSARLGLKQVADRMRDVVVENSDACRLISRLINTERCAPKPKSILFYIDPPYTSDSRKSMGEYIHDDFDHDALLEVITTAPSFCKFAVSGYDNDRYNTAFDGWYRAELETHSTASSTRKNSKRIEVLWRNYELADAMKQSHIDIRRNKP